MILGIETHFLTRPHEILTTREVCVDHAVPPVSHEPDAHRLSKRVEELHGHTRGCSTC
jgi:hypothetical protein